MILEIQHETTLEYSAPVREWLTELRMEPVTDSEQCCHLFHIAVSQPTSVHRYSDGFGNHVHHFNLLTPHRHVRLLAASIVETDARRRDLMTSQAAFPLQFDNVDLSIYDFLQLRGPVSQTALLEPLLRELRPREHGRIGMWLCQAGEYIRSHFEYARYFTDANSPIDDILQHGKGVCQDFAHLMIAVCRSFGVPARYVSGYIHRPNKDSQSHAWCEVWIPDMGWVGFDPTNGCPTSERFIKVAIGRDFTDVPPNKGTYRGDGNEQINVRVATRELERMPSLAWQEQLPPLDVPITAIARHRREDSADEQILQQQQQQQQA